jgi:FkbM family methyltransferase
MASAASNFVKDLALLGPQFAGACAAARLKTSGTVSVPVSGFGTITVRCRDSDTATLRQVFRDREYHIGSQEMRSRLDARYATMLADGKVPVIVDTGANIGAAAVWFSALYPKARVLAVEPDPANFAILAKNAEGRFEAVEAALGGERGHVEAVRSGQSWATQTRRSDAGIAMLTITDLVAQVPDGELLLAKIDIEGFESDLFDGDCRWLDECAVVMVEPHDWMQPGTSASFQRELGKRDFDMLINGENLVYVRRPGARDVAAQPSQAPDKEPVIA